MVWEVPLEEKMATHSMIRAWEILWMEEFGELQSMGSPRVRHNRACTQHIFAKLNEEPYKHVYSGFQRSHKGNTEPKRWMSVFLSYKSSVGCFGSFIFRDHW